MALVYSNGQMAKWVSYKPIDQHSCQGKQAKKNKLLAGYTFSYSSQSEMLPMTHGCLQALAGGKRPLVPTGEDKNGNCVGFI